MRMSVPPAVRSSMLIQFSPVVSDLDLPCDVWIVPGSCAVIAAGNPPPATGRNPSGTSALLYLRFHQKYWCSGIPFSFNRFLMEMPFSWHSVWISSICSRVSIFSVCVSATKLGLTYTNGNMYLVECLPSTFSFFLLRHSCSISKPVPLLPEPVGNRLPVYCQVQPAFIVRVIFHP